MECRHDQPDDRHVVGVQYTTVYQEYANYAARIPTEHHFIFWWISIHFSAALLNKRRYFWEDLDFFVPHSDVLVLNLIQGTSVHKGDNCAFRFSDRLKKWSFGRNFDIYWMKMKWISARYYIIISNKNKNVHQKVIHVTHENERAARTFGLSAPYLLFIIFF